MKKNYTTIFFEKNFYAQKKLTPVETGVATKPNCL